MQTPDSSPSLLYPIGYRNGSCGYCNGKSGSFSYYASSTSMQPSFYKALLDRGWRRSGTLLYKPDLRASCCAQYTIRLDSESFRASKDQRQTLNRISKFMLGDAYSKEAARRFPKSRIEARKRDNEFDLLDRVHECELAHTKAPELKPAHELTVTLEPDDFTDEKYALFENYQRLVHKEPPSRISEHGFKNFLCSSPLARSDPSSNSPAMGSFHQCYRIDGRLIAIGVLDLLPECVSAVYFMYHESVHQHQLGKVGALREIALAREKGYQYWYAGFYIHSCLKMRYKGDYKPQYVLDPESLGWDLFDSVLKSKLDERKYVSLSHDASHPGVALSQIPLTGEINVESPCDTSDDSDDESVPHPELPVFARSMPGVLTETQLLAEIDLDHIKLSIHGEQAETCDLVDWDLKDVTKVGSLKCLIGELAAVVGPELAAEMVISF